jgi:chorismate synthase
MSGANSFGSRLILSSFGESHGAALGALLDGVPAGVVWRDDVLVRELARRRPGQSALVSGRAEADEPEVLSGVYRGKTLGTPIAIIVRNIDARSADYSKIAKSPRTGHADDVWVNKFGHSDPRGGGRSSGRETVSRVMGGAVARMILSQIAPDTRIIGFASQIGPHVLNEGDLRAFEKLKGTYPADRFPARFPSKTQAKGVEDLLTRAKTAGQSYGGIAEVRIDGLPSGLGQPVFHKLKADLASAFMSLGATAGVEVGDGFEVVAAEGAEFHGRGKSDPARYGGMRGGISTGERLIFRAAFKPTSSVLDVARKGRHDPCIVPRAIPVLEAMAALVVADHLLWSRTDRA